MHTDMISMVVARTASKIGLHVIPEFVRWTKSGGAAKKRYYNKSGAFFTLPIWLKNEPLEYQIAYIVHETCHFAPDSSWSHDQGFYAAERAGLAVWGLTPHFVGNERYLSVLTNENGEVVWTKATANTKLRHVRLAYGESR